MSFEEAKTWYDGYQLVAHRQWKDECYSMYNPKSVVEAMLRHKFGTYWNQTETYEALKIYIQMDMDGLKASSKLIPYFSQIADTSGSVKPKYSANSPGSVIEYSVNIFSAE